MLVTPDEAQAFRDHVGVSLARDPARMLATLTQVYTADKISEARGWVALAAHLAEPPDPPVIPEPHEPGEKTCNWCGRKEEHASGGLTGDYSEPTLTTNMVPASGGLPVPGPAGSHHQPEPWEKHIKTTDADLHCRDSDACDAHRQKQLAAWRSKWEAAETANRQRRAMGTSGYHGGFRREGFKGPSWLTQVADKAEITLSGYEVVRQCVSGWIWLTLAVAETEDGFLGLTQDDSAPPVSPPFAPVPKWSHNLSESGMDRNHLLGAQMARFGITPGEIPPGRNPAQAARERAATPKRLRQSKLDAYRRHRTRLANRWRHRPPGVS